MIKRVLDFALEGLISIAMGYALGTLIARILQGGW